MSNGMWRFRGWRPVALAGGTRRSPKIQPRGWRCPVVMVALNRVVVGGGQQWQVVAVALEAAVGIAIAPVIVDDVAEAQVLDADATPVDQPAIGRVSSVFDSAQVQ